MNLEPKTLHQTPMTSTYGFSHFRHFQNCCNRDGNTIFKYMNYVPIVVATDLEVPFSVLKKGVPILLSIVYIQVIGVWWWVFGSRFIYSHTRGLIYKMLRRNHPKFDFTIISKICVSAIHRMNVRTEIARTRLFQMINLWIANDLELARNWLVSALCLVNDS